MANFSIRIPTPRLLKSEAEVNQFSISCQRWMGVRFPLSYLAQNRVIGFFTHENELVGGFALITQPPFRVMQSLPQTAQHKITELGYTQDSLFEITGLWLHPEHKSRIANLLFYLTIYKEVLFIRRPYFIYAYSSSKPKLGQIYSVAQPITIYEGPTSLLPGMTEVDDEVIQIGSVAALNTVWRSNPKFLLNRLRRQRSASFYQKPAIEL